MPRKNPPRYRVDSTLPPPYQLLEANNSRAPPPPYPEPEPAIEPVVEPPMKPKSPLGFTRMLEKIGHGKERYERFRGRGSSVSSSTSTSGDGNATPETEDWNLSVGRPRETPPEGYDFVLVLHGQKSKKCLWTYTVANGSNGWNKIHTEYPCEAIGCSNEMDLYGVGVIEAQDQGRFKTIFNDLPPASSETLSLRSFCISAQGRTRFWSIGRLLRPWGR
ncbi:hypothetical protein BDV19DRAFT_384077 [Aspergillus venezuelensis]